MLLYLLLFLEFRLAVIAVGADSSVCNLKLCNCVKVSDLQISGFRSKNETSMEEEEEEELLDYINVSCRCTRRTKVLSFGRTSGKSIIPEGVNDLLIHNCFSVTLSAGAFGVRAAQKIHLKDIYTLNVEKWAFRRDLVSMRLIKLENIENLVVHSEAFTGIHNENEIYFKNVTWKYVRTRTFSNISDISGLHFQSLKTSEIGPHAFWKVDNVKEFSIVKLSDGNESCEVDKVNSYAVAFASKNFTVHKCNLGVIRTDAFHVSTEMVTFAENILSDVESYSLGFVFSQFSFSRNEVKRFRSNAFSRLHGNKGSNETTKFFFEGNTFRNISANSLDLGDESSITLFHVLDNAFDCHCKNLSWFHTLHKDMRFGGVSHYYELMLDESVCSEHHNDLVVAYRDDGCESAVSVKIGNPFLDFNPFFVIPASIAAFLLLLCIFCRCCLKSRCSRHSGEFV